MVLFWLTQCISFIAFDFRMSSVRAANQQLIHFWVVCYLREIFHDFIHSLRKLFFNCLSHSRKPFTRRSQFPRAQRKSSFSFVFRKAEIISRTPNWSVLRGRAKEGWSRDQQTLGLNETIWSKTQNPLFLDVEISEGTALIVSRSAHNSIQSVLSF